MCAVSKENKKESISLIYANQLMRAGVNAEQSQSMYQKHHSGWNFINDKLWNSMFEINFGLFRKGKSKRKCGRVVRFDLMAIPSSWVLWWCVGLAAADDGAAASSCPTSFGSPRAAVSFCSFFALAFRIAFELHRSHWVLFPNVWFSGVIFRILIARVHIECAFVLIERFIKREKQTNSTE